MRLPSEYLPVTANERFGGFREAAVVLTVDEGVCFIVANMRQ